MRKHARFIQTPITLLMDESLHALSLVGHELSSYPLGDYMMQSLFLKMTGFQEQKVKCILWELATDDYALRYKRFRKNPISEGSSLDDKNHVLEDLVGCIESRQKGKSRFSDDEKNDVIDSTKEAIRNFAHHPATKGWMSRSWMDFDKRFGDYVGACILYESKGVYQQLFKPCASCAGKKKAGSKCAGVVQHLTLKDLYEKMYRHRNRCAHNVTSYQQNLPSLDTLKEEDFLYENYLFRFALLILCDKIFVELFNRYLSVYPEPFKL